MVSGINSIFVDKRTVEQDLGHLFVTSSSSQFFNKTDFEHCVF